MGQKERSPLTHSICCLYGWPLLKGWSTAEAAAKLATIMLILGYADDTALMALSVKGLQTIIGVNVDCARKYEVIYNGSKSQFLIFPSYVRSHKDRYIRIDGNVLPYDNFVEVIIDFDRLC